jgi:hypothetical protein
MTGVSSKIYSAKIENSVNTLCKGIVCKVLGTNIDNSSGNNNAIIDYYILQVMAHEMGHGSKLGANKALYPKSTASPANYNHYTDATKMMAPTASFASGVWTIPTTWDMQLDPQAVSLK